METQVLKGIAEHSFVKGVCIRVLDNDKQEKLTILSTIVLQDASLLISGAIV